MYSENVCKAGFYICTYGSISEMVFVTSYLENGYFQDKLSKLHPFNSYKLSSYKNPVAWCTKSKDS